MSKILLVESYPNLGSLYREILSEEGHQVFLTSSCKEAQTIAKNNDIDLVVIDKSSPDKCAEELLRTIKTIQPNINAVLCPLNKFSQKIYRELCDVGFLKTSDYTTLLKRISDLNRKLPVSDRENL
jgi:DNA-binding response OmpR family regulator